MSDSKPNSQHITIGVIVVSVLLTGISLWVGSLQTTVTDVISLKPQITRLQSETKDLKIWQDNWVTNGELPADVKQNKDIEHLTKLLLDVKAKVDAIEDRVNEIRIEQAKNK